MMSLKMIKLSDRIPPPPMPLTERPMSMLTIPCDAQQTIDPMVNKMIARRNNA
jgi:hypothetical protein